MMKYRIIIGIAIKNGKIIMFNIANPDMVSILLFFIVLSDDYHR